MDHHKVDFENVARVVMALGLIGFKNLSAQMPACSVKYAGFTIGEAEAILNILGEANIQKMLSGEVSIEIKEIVRKLVDKNGRIIPLVGMKSDINDPDTNFRLVQPTINYAERLNRLIKFFPLAVFVSAEEFQKRSERLIRQLQEDPVFSNLCRGVWLPVCYPQFKLTDYGTNLENIFLKAVGNSYDNQFPEWNFFNHHEDELEGKVEIVDESHKRFIAKMAEGPVVGIQFFPLQGFSINADREMMSALPKSLYLSGAIDLAVAMTAYPDVLTSDFSAPDYDCAAVSWKSAACSLIFRGGGGLGFDSTDNLSSASGHYSGGLVFLG